MGAYTQYRIFSLRKRQEIKPHRTEGSKSGNHWTDYWYLLPGKYFVAWRDISNTSRHRCGYGLLVVGSNGDYGIAEWVGDAPEFAKKAICDCISPRERHY
jgi:hypothetical protein